MNSVVNREPDVNPIEETYVDDPTEDNTTNDNLENPDNEILFEGLVKVASPKSDKAPENANILGISNLKRQNQDNNFRAF